MNAAQISQLCQASCFSHPVDNLQLIETHISWVILTGAWVYKIKKPVDFGFLDFSTLEKREFCCHEEVRLNNRTGADLYVAVVPVCESAAGLSIEGEGTVIDFAVKMRQFDPRATLKELLEAGEVPIGAFGQMGYQIAAFHQVAAIAALNSPWGSVAAVVAPVEENFRQILACVNQLEQAQVQALAAQARVSAEALASVFATRKSNGFVRELHGDLHAGNVARIDGNWVPFDCIEFNPNLRWIDTASDIAFLIMDLEFLGYRKQANRFLNAYLEYSGDYALLQVLGFYQCYRAMVRAKVATLRRQQAEDANTQSKLLGEFHGYLNYCITLQRTSKPFLVMMMGVSGSGKSTVAKQIANEYGAIHIRSDVVRKRLFGLRPDETSAEALRPTLYSETVSAQTFQAMREQVETLLQLGYPVIVDATFIKHATRTPFLELAQKLQLPVAILSCEAPPSILEDRIRQRQAQASDPSEADIDVMHNQLAHVEPCVDAELALVVRNSEPGWEVLLRQRIKPVEC